MKVIKIFDKWVCKSDYGETQYYYFKSDEGNYCVSKCVHYNGMISYCLSNENCDYITTQDETELIYKGVEDYDLQENRERN